MVYCQCARSAIRPVKTCSLYFKGSDRKSKAVVIAQIYALLLLYFWQMTKRLQKTLERTQFAGCPTVAVAAKPSSIEVGRVLINFGLFFGDIL